EWQQLEKVRQELETQKKQAEATHNDAALKRLDEQQKQREADLARQQQEITQLRKERGQLEGEAAGYRRRLDELNAQLEKVEKEKSKPPPVALSDPTIEMIEPQLVTRGGIPSVTGRPGIERVIIGRVTAPAGLQTFTVNDRQEKPDEKGL